MKKMESFNNNLPIFLVMSRDKRIVIEEVRMGFSSENRCIFLVLLGLFASRENEELKTSWAFIRL